MKPDAITTSQALESVAQLLEMSKDKMVTSDNPFINEQLKQLLSELYTVQKNAGALSIPVVLDLNNASTSELIEILITQTRKTNALVTVATEFEIKQSANKIVSANENQLKKLQEAQKSADEAQKLSDGLGIFKWVMFALSIILTVVSAIATVCTFGGAAPLLAVSLGVLAVSTAFLIATSVPVDDENHSVMDLASEKISKAISDAFTNSVKKQMGDKWDKLSDEQQQEVFNKADENGNYSAMGIMLAINTMIALAMLALTIGTSAGTSATMIATSATKATESSVKTALQTAKEAVTNNMPMIIKATRITNGIGQIIKAGGTIAQSGVSIDGAIINLEAKENRIQADTLKAYAKFLTDNEEILIELINELNETTTASYKTVVDMIKASHKQNRQVIAGYAGASSV